MDPVPHPSLAIMLEMLPRSTSRRVHPALVLKGGEWHSGAPPPSRPCLTAEFPEHVPQVIDIVPGLNTTGARRGGLSCSSFPHLPVIAVHSTILVSGTHQKVSNAPCWPHSVLVCVFQHVTPLFIVSTAPQYVCCSSGEKPVSCS